MDLLNCPWCGGLTEVVKASPIKFFVTCKAGSCNAMGPNSTSHAGAVGAWARVVSQVPAAAPSDRLHLVASGDVAVLGSRL